MTSGVGPLRPNPDNPRYFRDQGTGRTVLLTGTHTWNVFQDMGNPLSSFDYARYLDFLAEHRMNFIRLWVWEHARWGPWSSDENYRVEPLCYARTGPGNALDGQPRFDLDRWNSAYFDRLLDRVARAGNRGIYVAVMLFSGCSIGSRGWPSQDVRTGLPVGNPWLGHPFNRANNRNGVDGDPSGRQDGWDMRSVDNRDIISRQHAYVRKVSDFLGSCANVLFEVANEDTFDTSPWQEEIVRFLQEHEASTGRGRPVGMSASWNQPNEVLYDSHSDWIAPAYDEQAAIEPHVARGGKVWIADSDHVFPNMGLTMDFTWKSFLRGANPISMDHRKAGKAWQYFLGKAPEAIRHHEADEPGSLSEGDFRSLLGDVSQRRIREAAERLDLARAVPAGGLSSTGYCLADPGRAYLVYQPEREGLVLNLEEVHGELEIEWLDPVGGTTQTGEKTCGGTAVRFEPPFAPAVLRVWVPQRGVLFTTATVRRSTRVRNR